MEPIINYLAVLVAAIVAFVLGGLWYGPLFSKPWMKLTGITKDGPKATKLAMWQSLVLMAIGSFIMAGVLAHELAYAGAFMNVSGLPLGIQGGFWIWLGFIAPVTAGVVLWEGKSWKLWVLNAGYYLVSLCLMGAIIASWA